MLIPFGLFGKTAFHGRAGARQRHLVRESRYWCLPSSSVSALTLFSQFTQSASAQTLTVDQAMAIVLAARCRCSVSASSVPGIANGLVSGGPQLGAAPP